MEFIARLVVKSSLECDITFKWLLLNLITSSYFPRTFTNFILSFIFNYLRCFASYFYYTNAPYLFAVIMSDNFKQYQRITFSNKSIIVRFFQAATVSSCFSNISSNDLETFLTFPTFYRLWRLVERRFSSSFFSRNDQKSVISETSHDERSSTSAPKKWMFSDKVGRSTPFRSVNDTLDDLSSPPVIVLDCLSMNRDPFGSFSNLSRRSISPAPVSSVFAEKFRETMARYVNERNNGTMRTQGC